MTIIINNIINNLIIEIIIIPFIMNFENKNSFMLYLLQE